MIKKSLIFLAFTAILFAQKSRPQRTVTFTAGGTGNAITGTPSPALTAYSDLSTNPLTQVCFTATATSTAAVTVNLNALGAKALKKTSAGVISDAGNNDVVTGQYVCAVYLSSPDYLMLVSPAGNLGAGSSSLWSFNADCTETILSASTTGYCGYSGWFSLIGGAKVVAQKTGTLKNLRVATRGFTNPIDIVCTVMLNAVATSMTITVPNGAFDAIYSDTVNTASATAGDVFNLRCVCNSGGNGTVYGWGIVIE